MHNAQPRTTPGPRQQQHPAARRGRSGGTTRAPADGRVGKPAGHGRMQGLRLPTLRALRAGQQGTKHARLSPVRVADATPRHATHWRTKGERVKAWSKPEAEGVHQGSTVHPLAGQRRKRGHFLGPTAPSPARTLCATQFTSHAPPQLDFLPADFTAHSARTSCAGGADSGLRPPHSLPLLCIGAGALV